MEDVMKNKQKNKFDWLAGIGLALGICFFTSTIIAAVPTRINFQGKLLDTNKNPRNGSFNLVFRICDTPASSCASPIWTESQTGVPVTNGVFSLQLGSVTPLPATAFSSDERYLEIQIGSEVSSQREKLVTSPYAFKAAVADSLAPGDANYIQSTNSLQSGATFYVSSGTVAGDLAVGGVIKAGTANTQITNAAGALDAAKLSGTLPNASLIGPYTNSLTFSSNTNVFAGDGAGLTNVTAKNLLPGDTNYIQNRTSVQEGSAFYVSSAAVGGSLTATGTVSLGGVAGTDDVIVNSDLKIGGDVRVNGNDIQDSAGTNRLTLGSNIQVNGVITVPENTIGLQISTSVLITGAANGDNYIAFPFTAGGTINDRDLVIINGANAITTTASAANTAALGFAVNSGALGDTVYVALQGIVTGAVTNGAVTVGARVCSAASAGRIDDACNADGVTIGKALTGSTGAGQTIKVVLMAPR